MGAWVLSRFPAWKSATTRRSLQFPRGHPWAALLPARSSARVVRKENTSRRFRSSLQNHSCPSKRRWSSPRDAGSSRPPPEFPSRSRASAASAERRRCRAARRSSDRAPPVRIHTRIHLRVSLANTVRLVSGLCPSGRCLSWCAPRIGFFTRRGCSFVPRAKFFRNSRTLHPHSHKLRDVFMRFLLERGNQIAEFEFMLPPRIEHVPRSLAKRFASVTVLQRVKEQKTLCSKYVRIFLLQRLRVCRGRRARCILRDQPKCTPNRFPSRISAFCSFTPDRRRKRCKHRKRRLLLVKAWVLRVS